MQKLKFLLLVIIVQMLFAHAALVAQSPIEEKVRQVYRVADSLYQQEAAAEALDTLLSVLPQFNYFHNDTLESKVLGLFGHLQKNMGNDTVGIGKFMSNLENRQLKKYLKAVDAMGLYFEEREHFIKALSYYKKMILFATALNDTLSLGEAYFKTGKVFKALLNYPKAEAYFKQALIFFNSSNATQYIVKLYNQLGDMNSELDQPDSAVFYFEKAITHARNTQSNISRVIAYHRLAIITGHKGNFTEASSYFNQARELATRYHAEYLPGIYYDWGVFLLESGRTIKAKIILEKCIKQAVKHHNTSTRINAAKHLAGLYARENNNKQAIKYYQLSMRLADSMQQINSVQEMARFEARYNLMQKEQEIALLDRERKLKAAKLKNQELRSKLYMGGLFLLVLLVGVLLYHIITHIRKNRLLSAQNAKINEQNEELSQINQQLSDSENHLMQALATKNKLFAIIGHDLKSPLMDIKNLIFILKKNPGQFEADALRKHTIQIENRLVSLLELLNNLLNWGMAERNTLKYTPQKVDLVRLISKTVNLFEGVLSNKNINVNTHLPTALNWYTDFNMMEFVLRNILSNAIKFSDEENQIDIKAGVDYDRLHITIVDYGMGMTAEQLDKIFEGSSEKVRRGTQNEKGTGLGLSVSYEFVKQMGGSITLESKPKKGTSVELVFENNKRKNEF